jgi:hypothetical protein
MPTNTSLTAKCLAALFACCVAGCAHKPARKPPESGVEKEKIGYLQVSPVTVEQGEEKIDLKVEVEREAGEEVVLRLRLSNPGTKPLKLPAGSLPWDRQAMAIALVAAEGHALEESGIPGVAAAGQPSILEAEKLVDGRFSLEKHFPKLGAALKKGDVILFWSYQLTTSEKTMLPRTGGWLVIPKEK